jgi:biopolymer transport protein ExbB
MIAISILLQTAGASDKLNVQQIAGQHLSFFELLMKGGVILIPIGILSLISIYLISEKYFGIHKATRVSKKTRSDFKLHMQKGETEKALDTLKSCPGAYSAIFSHAVKNTHLPANEVEEELENVSNIEMSKIGRNLPYLGLIAGIAPMLGFIGTISGIIKIFYNISVTDNISIGIIAGGLYEKMISSGSGLIVGVIAYSGYHLLNMIVDKFISLVEADAFEIMNILKAKEKVARQ